MLDDKNKKPPCVSTRGRCKTFFASMLKIEIPLSESRSKGFTKLPNIIFEFDTTPSEFKVLALLYHHLPQAFPSLERLAKMTNMSRRQVIRIINSLEEKKLIHKEMRPNQTTIYFPRQKKNKA